MPRIVGRRIIPIKTKKYREYEQLMVASMVNQVVKLPEMPLALYAYLYAPRSFWFSKKGLAKRNDADNYMKALLDSFCNTMDFDDKWFFELHIFKATSKDFRVDLYINEETTTFVVS